MGMSKKLKIGVVASIALLAVIGAVGVLLFYSNSASDETPDAELSPQSTPGQTAPAQIPDAQMPKTEITLAENLTFEINSELQLLSLVEHIANGEIVSEDEMLDMSALGEHEVVILYLNEENEIKELYASITVIDTQEPIIEYEGELETTQGTEIDLLAGVRVIDNSNEEIIATVEGEYDFDAEGEYSLKYIAVDGSGNKAESDFILTVTRSAAPGSGAGSGGGNGGGGGSGTNQGNAATPEPTPRSLDMSAYDRSHPMVDKALSLVGSTHMSCTALAEAALNVVDKSLSVPLYYALLIDPPSERVNVTEEYAMSAHTIEKRWEWGIAHSDGSGTPKITTETLFHVSNNIITNITAKEPSLIEEGWVPLWTVIARMHIGDCPYYGRVSVWTESGIKKIGTQVSLSDVRPGDFLYWEPGSGGSGRSHIAIYVGNEDAVHGGWGSGDNVVLGDMYPSVYTSPTAWRVDY
ncbi:MAG: NlpC/P60 family protein [Oscillospiraceae bacterium]|nr:NlpC/P60 family protein [Oscillospiraceae bacterium]